MAYLHWVRQVLEQYRSAAAPLSLMVVELTTAVLLVVACIVLGIFYRLVLVVVWVFQACPQSSPCVFVLSFEVASI